MIFFLNLVIKSQSSEWAYFLMREKFLMKESVRRSWWFLWRRSQQWSWSKSSKIAKFFISIALIYTCMINNFHFILSYRYHIYLLLVNNYMSDQFTFDEINLFSWNQSVSLKSYKNPNFTMSDVSNSHQLNPYQTIQEQDEQWNLEEFNKKAEKKLKNRTNVKKFRQKQKTQQSKLLEKLKLLQHENQLLKNQKYCRHCKRPFGGLIQLTQASYQNPTSPQDSRQNQQLHPEGKQCFEFQKPTFYSKTQLQTSNRKGKIWIALGILMMVIGVHLYGFRGKQGYQDISISKIQSKKIIDMYQGKSNPDVNDYFDVKVKYKSKGGPAQTEKKYDIFKEIRIFHEEQQEQKVKKYASFARQTLSRLQMMEQQNQKSSKTHEFELQKQQEVRFHKDIFYAMQAQIDQVGQYI